MEVNNFIAPFALVIMGTLSTATVTAGETREGYVMPELCKSRTASTPAEHTTECALEAECVASGFGLYVDNGFLAFDEEGDEIAAAYFRSTERNSSHRVSVTGDFSGDEVHVETLVPVDP